MAATDPLFFNSLPPDIAAQVGDLQTRRSIMQALLQRGLAGAQPPQQHGRLASPMSPFAALAPVAEAYAGVHGLKDVNAQEMQLGQRYNEGITNAILSSQAAREGTPGSPGAPATGPTDQTSPSAATAATPPTAGNANIANAMLLQHPVTRGLGLEMAKRGMEMKMFTDEVAKYNAGQAGGGTGLPGANAIPTATGSPMLPGMPAGFGGPAGGSPMSAWLIKDPTGGLYLEALQKDIMEQRRPVVNRGWGIGTMIGGKYVADPASLEQAKQAEQMKADIGAQYETPINLKMSGGQEIQLSRPEFKEFQKSGQLPDRYTQQSSQAVEGQPGSWLGKEPVGAFTGDPQQIAAQISRDIKDPTERAAALRAVQNQSGGGIAPKPGMGVPGASQTQADVIEQKGQTAAAEALGAGIGKEAHNTLTEGAQAVQANRQLDNMSQLATGFTPDRLQSLKSSFGAYLNGFGMPEAEVNKLLGTSVGDIRALTSQAVQMAGKLTRQTDSQPSQIQFLKNLQSMPNADMTEEGFKKVISYMRDMNNYRIEKMIAQQQYLQQKGGNIAGFEPYWAEKSKAIPFIWNQQTRVDPNSGALVRPATGGGGGAGWKIERVQ